MKVLIDALTAREGGGISYVTHLLPELARTGDHEYHVLLSGRYQQELMRSLPPTVRPRAVDLRASDLVRRLWFEQVDLPGLIRREGFHVLFTVNEVGSVRPPCPHVVLGRNLNIYAPLRTAGGARQRLQLLLYRLTRQPVAYLTLRAADRVAFVSDAACSVVTKRLGLDPRKTVVVYHGVSPAFYDAAAAPDRGAHASDLRGGPNAPRGPYLLSVSSVAPHKNYETLLRAYAGARATRATPPLVIAGAISDRALFAQLRALSASLGVADCVHFVGRVPANELPRLYRGALAFVFPSRLESFGLPLVEAMAAGVPVIASDLPVCTEICQDAALYFDAASSDALAERITTVLGDPEAARAMAARGRARARLFTWERSAAEMRRLFEDVAPAAAAAVGAATA